MPQHWKPLLLPVHPEHVADTRPRVHSALPNSKQTSRTNSPAAKLGVSVAPPAPRGSSWHGRTVSLWAPGGARSPQSVAFEVGSSFCVFFVCLFVSNHCLQVSNSGKLTVRKMLNITTIILLARRSSCCVVVQFKEWFYIVLLDVYLISWLTLSHQCWSLSHVFWPLNLTMTVHVVLPFNRRTCWAAKAPPSSLSALGLGTGLYCWYIAVIPCSCKRLLIAHEWLELQCHFSSINNELGYNIYLLYWN